MAKQLWCVRKGGAVVEGPTGTKFWAKKGSAKKARNALQGDLPKNPEMASEWMYRVSPGPDHWRSHA